MANDSQYNRLNVVNLDSEHVCCAIAGQKHQQGVDQKKRFLSEGFKGGLVFQKLDVRGKVFVEYAPWQSAWRPVIAPKYLIIHCLWVSGRFKEQGHGRALLTDCLTDASQADGVAAVSGSHPYLTDTKFFLHHGFEVAEKLESGFDLVYWKRRKTAELPAFSNSARRGTVRHKQGVHFEFTHQCPLVNNCLEEMKAVVADLGLSVSCREIRTPAQAKNAASPFGTFGAFLNGKFLTHELMSAGGFRKLLDKRLSTRN